MRKVRLYIIFIISILFIGCSDNSTEPSKFTPLEVDIRMEVQILDSTHMLFSRPHTQIYFTTYKLTRDNLRVELEQSDTTSCPNGWGVKLLNFRFENEDEKIVLGAANEKYVGPNYREVEISYTEAEGQIDSENHSSIKKTFAIYYQ